MLRLLLVFAIGYFLGGLFHPWEECERKYASFNDVTECMWIKEMEGKDVYRP
jgi:hypothetical protein